MGIKAFVDRIEGRRAVLILQEDETFTFNLPISMLPGVTEGDVLNLVITKDETSTGEIRERVSAQIEKLKKKGKKPGDF